MIATVLVPFYLLALPVAIAGAALHVARGALFGYACDIIFALSNENQIYLNKYHF